MNTEQMDDVIVEVDELKSRSLTRTVKISFFHLPGTLNKGTCRLLLINDGQDLQKMEFDRMLSSFGDDRLSQPLLVAGIHCGDDRMMDYGMSVGPDYQGRGARAALYDRFVVSELLPFIHGRFARYTFSETAFAGFSMGGLSAFDIAWNHPEIFSRIGVFSGSLWWRSLSQDDKDYDMYIHRMMHQQVKHAPFHPDMKFFFQCGELDEKEDRNRNGVIDSIDDTIDLMRELVKKGYREGRDIRYLQLADGKHDITSWAKAMPLFLEWGWAGPQL